MLHEVNNNKGNNKKIFLLAFFDGPNKNVLKIGDSFLYENSAIDFINDKIINTTTVAF